MEVNHEVNDSEKDYQKVVNDGLRIIKNKYGSNDGDGYEPLRYHNLIHTKKVLESAEKMADMAIAEGRLTQRQKELIAIAACFHDIEQDMSFRNEEESGRIAEEHMRKMKSFSDEEIETVKRIIGGTRCYWDDTGHLGQITNGTDLMEAIVADADMNNAGEKIETFVEVSLNLAVENDHKSSTNEVDMAKFWKFQARFLRDRKFFTPYADKLFPFIKENTEYVSRQIKLLDGISQQK